MMTSHYLIPVKDVEERLEALLKYYKTSEHAHEARLAVCAELILLTKLKRYPQIETPEEPSRN